MPRCSLLAVLVAVASYAVAVPAAAQALDVSPAAADAALGYLRGQAPALGLASDDVAGLVVASGHTSDRSGVTYVYVRQQLDGLDVVQAQVTVAVGRDGRIVHTAGELVADLAASAEPMAGGNRVPALSAESALRAAAGHAGIFLGAVTTEAVEGGRAQETRFQADGLSSPSRVRQVYVQTDGGAVRRAWEVVLDDARSEHWWVVAVDAATGAELDRYDLTVSESFGTAAASLAPVATTAPRSPLLDPDAFLGDALSGGQFVAGYKVFPMPYASPLYVPSPPPADGRTTVSGAENALASPYGWHDTNGAAGAEFTTTRGNNTHTYIDRNDDELPDAAYPAPDGGAALLFDFPINFTQAPSTYTSAAATNLFYWSNIIHDVTYRYGFTEAAGNFQTNNYGRGGLGNDAVDSEVQSGADICNEANPCHNNANFGTPIDGNRPRMQMYDGTNVTPAVDGSLDAHVVVHEYGHGISNRLVAGGAGGCLGNTEQMGEGWSDWYGNMLTMRAGDTRTTLRPVGNYLFGQPVTDGGIRPAPYSTDFAVNDWTYGHTRPSANGGRGPVVPHGIGFVWATALWDVTWDLIDAYGFSADIYNAAGPAGNQIALSLVTEALKLTPCNPGFVSGRDAVIAADAAVYPDASSPGRGLHYALLWNAFARRGLGFSASQGLTSSNADNTEAFNVPLPAAAASVTPSSVGITLAPNGTGTATVTFTNMAAASADLNFTSFVENATAPLTGPGALALVTAGSDRQEGISSLAGAETPWLVESPSVLTAPGRVTVSGVAQEPVARGAAAVSCVGGQTLNQESANFYGVVTSGGAEYGQSFTAPCTGFLNTITPFMNFTASPGTAWAATMRVYSGAGTLGTQLSALSFTYTNGPTGTGGYLNVPLSSPPFVTQGQVYTWFLDMTSGATGLQYTSSNVYAGGSRYQTTNGNPANATAVTTSDMNARLAFAAPANWVRASTTGGSVPSGASRAVTISFDATGLSEGTYTADLVVTTNAPNLPSTTIPITLTVGGRGTITGGPGWRMLAAPAAGVTVADLAAMNLVQGIPGYYPTAGSNLLTGYTGSGYTSPTGGTNVLASGRGFWWYFYNIEGTPGPSTSHALPTTLATTRPAVTTDVPVALHAAGTKYNLLGNPFGTSMSLASVASWPGASNLASTVAQVWDPSTSSYDVSLTLPTVAPWQGFWVEGATAGTLTIPASARTAGGVLQRDAAAPMLAFTLAGEDPATGAALQDRAAVLTFPEGATDDADAFDAAKLTPFASVYVSAAFGGAEVLRAVESRPAPTATAVAIPLHVASVGAGERLVLLWPLSEAIPETWALTLTDLATGATVDLRTASEYAFTVAPEAAQDPLAVPTAGLAVTPARFVVTVGPRGATATEGGAAAVFALDAPAPNPARGTVALAYSLAEAGAARVSLVDLLGREVAVVVAGEQAAGRHAASLDVSGLAPGVYVVRLSSGGDALARRIVVVR
ncbi:MAG TPA: M36 family metallopeptidase [Rubricoccaceae bacterium]|jgi:hypothetical protein